MTVATEDASQSAATRSRFVVGIDLGTTNSAVGYVDTHEGDGRIHTFAIAQLVAPGQVERRETLPSFHYEPAAEELAAGALRLPWSRDEPRYGVGVFAREHGRSVPGRLIESAKSWLCHAGVDRHAALLPWHGAADVEQLSPVEVSARYLRHIREAWEASFPDEPLERQDVVLTIPASFEEVARELTLAAARSAGLPRIVLIEEPQAAFYAWVDAHRDNWEEQVAPGQTILICDVGGGTSDFTLLHVRRGDGDKLRFHRVAVGEHLILGGDNLDLALAHHIEHKLAGESRLEPRQWSVLVPTCRQVKETLLSAGAPDRLTFTLPGTGARLIGGSLQVQVTRDEVTQLLVEGFLPRVAVTDKPARRQSGFQEFGLPYAPDAAITRYLAAFLTAHRDDSDPAATAARPVDVLFNGGFFASPVLRERMLEVLGSWFSRPRKKWSPRVLQNERLDLAVAHGAAYFGMVRRGVGVRISAGLARTYYVGVEAAAGETAALCLIAAGTEPSAEPHAIDREFDVRTSEPVEFPIFVSSTRLTDRPGTLLPIDEEHMTSLPPIRTVLRTRKASERTTLKARLSARLSEIGTLKMWCQQVDGSRRWQLQFDVRSAVETQREAHTGAAEQSGIVDQELLDAADEMVQAVFGPTGRDDPAGLVKRLAARLELRREEWPPSLLRSIWASLMDCESGRRRGEQHEARWLNLLGFALRPGFGLAADDWRVEETWRTLRSGLVDRGASCQSEWWILWRRIAGGLNRGRQIELTSPVISVLRREYRATGDDKSGAGSKHAARWGASAEIWRALGAMEFLPPPVRIELGELIVHALAQPRFQPIRNALVWSLGRIGTRVPVNGPLNSVLPPDVVGDWLSRLLRSSEGTDSDAQLAVVQLARRTGDRYRDLPNDLRRQAVDYLERTATSSHFIELVRDGGSLDTDEASRVFGEALPTGLRLA